MKDEAIKSDILAALDIVAMERTDDGEFELIGEAPGWLAEFFPQIDSRRRQAAASRSFHVPRAVPDRRRELLGIRRPGASEIRRVERGLRRRQTVSS